MQQFRSSKCAAIEYKATWLKFPFSMIQMWEKLFDMNASESDFHTAWMGIFHFPYWKQFVIEFSWKEQTWIYFPSSRPNIFYLHKLPGRSNLDFIKSKYTNSELSFQLPFPPLPLQIDFIAQWRKNNIWRERKISFLFFWTNAEHIFAFFPSFVSEEGTLNEQNSYLCLFFWFRRKLLT